MSIMKLHLIIVVAVFTFLLTACDPGMSIRQAASDNPPGDLIINVKTARPLIGETWYSPHVEATNRSDHSITITRIELVTANAAYAPEPEYPAKVYPVEIGAGKTELLPAYFHKLQHAVYEEFKSPAELRVHYRVGSNEDVVKVTIEGGKLHDK